MKVRDKRAPLLPVPEWKNNEAILADTEARDNLNGCCDNFLLFALRDNYHEFSMGIKTILECLMVAENRGAVPELPPQWWIQVMGRYDLQQHEFQEKTDQLK